MRGRKPKFTQKEVIEALRSSGGIISTVARKLGCSRTTIYNYIQRYAKVREAYEEITETWLDIAEMKLLQKILEGDLRAITFYLRNKGASRGYGPVGKSGCLLNRPSRSYCLSGRGMRMLMLHNIRCDGKIKARVMKGR